MSEYNKNHNRKAWRFGRESCENNNDGYLNYACWCKPKTCCCEPKNCCGGFDDGRSYWCSDKYANKFCCREYRNMNVYNNSWLYSALGTYSGFGTALGRLNF